MTINRKTVPMNHRRTKVNNSYCDNLVPDSKITVNETDYPHTKLGFHKLKDVNLTKEFISRKKFLQQFTWIELLNQGSNILEAIYLKQVNIHIPHNYKTKKDLKKVWISRLNHSLRFGGLFESSTDTFYVFWIEDSQNQIYNHI